jgi:hypothetical protein
MIYVLLIGITLILFSLRFKVNKPLQTGEGVFVIPKGVKYVSVSVIGGGGGSGRNGTSTATVGVNSGDSEMVIKLKY